MKKIAQVISMNSLASSILTSVMDGEEVDKMKTLARKRARVSKKSLLLEPVLTIPVEKVKKPRVYKKKTAIVAEEAKAKDVAVEDIKEEAIECGDADDTEEDT